MSTSHSRAPAELQLSDLAAGGVFVAWHEAVAVVRTVASAALDHPSGAVVPDVSRIALHDDGTLTMDGAAGQADALVPALADVLRTLLPDSAPPELLLLADSSNLGVRASTPQEFIAALTFFARPDDSAEIRALVARGVEARESSGRARALEALTERARHAAPEPVASEAPARKLKLGLWLAVGAASVVVIVATAVGSRFLTIGSSAAAGPGGVMPPVAEAVAQRVQHGVASAAALITESLQGAPDRPAGRGADLVLPAAPRRRSRDRSRSQEAAVAAPPVALAESLRESADDVAEGRVPPERERPSTDGAPHALTAAPHGVYSAADPDVIPPALVRAQMPRSPIGGVPMARPGVLELVVGDDGQVLSARLVPSSSRLLDRMMVSAAKAWRFTPATLDGQSVDYRLQMPITW
jgi:TonB family protein